MIRRAVFVFVFTVVISSENTPPSDEDVLEMMMGSSSYVDKTLFIQQFFHGPQFIVITGPARFGKTSNMDTIKSFVEVRADPKSGETSNSSRSDMVELFRSRKIFEDQRFVEEHFGSYPVIRMSFNEILVETLKDFHNSFLKMMSDVFSRFEYLRKSGAVVDKDRAMFGKILVRKATLKFDDLERSGQLLARLLYEHNGRRQKCVLLIDDYDDPMLNFVMSKKGSKEDFKVIKSTLQSFIVNLIGDHDQFVERSLFTGSLRMTASFMSDKLKNLQQFSIFDKIFYKHYGFTESEVLELLERAGKEKRIEDVKHWYRGYIVLDTDDRVYNPRSILSYITTDKFGAHWAAGGGLKHLTNLFAFDKVGKILDQSLKQDIRVTIKEKLTETDFQTLRGLLAFQNCTEPGKHLTLQYLLESGYYTISKIDAQGPDGQLDAFLRIPNFEIQNELENLLINPIFFESKLGISVRIMESYIQTIETLDDSEGKYVDLARYVSNIFSIRMPDDEVDMLSTLHGISKLFGRLVVVGVQWNRSNKKLDLLILREDKVGIIIGLNYGQPTSFEALRQIFNTNYREIFKNCQVEKRIFVGLVLTKQCQCDISYVYDSFDFNDCKNVSYSSVINL